MEQGFLGGLSSTREFMGVVDSASVEENSFNASTETGHDPSFTLYTRIRRVQRHTRKKVADLGER
jgi:hypothetical protein